jgi:hypothetical protein
VTRLYCTYFDDRYLARGLAMIRSLRRHEPDAQIMVLCLNDRAESILRAMAEPGVHPVPLPAFEAGDMELAAAKADGRGAVEYYFTLTPSLVRYVLDRTPGVEMVTYLDGDLWFLANPQAIYRQMGEASVLIIPHGFTPAMRHQEKFGVYNVGWLSFRNDPRGRACLEWWRNRTNEWCFDRVDEANSRFCEQRYLDQFPGKFEGVHVLANRGANLAPWNVGASVISLRGGHVYADNDQVIFFHFHGIKQMAPREFLALHGPYRAPMVPVVRRALYQPYLRELLAIEREVEMRFGALNRSSVRELHGRRDSLWDRTKRLIRMSLAKLRGYRITVPE